MEGFGGDGTKKEAVSSMAFLCVLGMKS